MFYKRISFLFLLIIFSTKAFSAVFIVTSNADSGPGTLREALTLATANGSATQDIIQFNLPDLSVTGRTITLVSQLPDLSSNLIIDGTTQPGMPFGQSNAYVEISTPVNYISFVLFNGTGLNDVEFYGLYIYDYADISTSRPDLKLRTGLNITNSSNIRFGAPGKGNIIRGFNHHTMYFESITNIKMQSNIIGLFANNDLSETGLISYTADLTLLKCNNIEIGGQPNESNIMFCYLNIGFLKNSTGNKADISSNNFGVFQDGKSASWYFQDMNFVNLFTIDLDYFGASDSEMAQSATADITVKNNVSGNFGNIFIINTLKGTINFTNNYFGIGRDGVTDINLNSHPNEGAPIRISSCLAQINVGTNNLADKNFLAYCTVGVVAEHSSNIFIRCNEYECITNLAYGNDNSSGLLPAININEVDNASIQTILKGTATPSATIDIYSSESCTYANCSIRSYIGTTTANNNGNWQYNIPNLTGTFYASATVGNQTSEFTTAKIDSKNLNIQNIRCSGPAVISGLQVPKGLSYYWVDGSGNIVSNDLILQTNKTGKYQLVLGEGCIKSDYFEIDDDRIVIYDFSFVKTDVSCGNNNGSINNLYVYDPLSKVSSETWADVNGNHIGNTVNITNLAAGSYTLTVKTSDGCTTSYGPVIIKNLSGPNIDQSKTAIQSTNCAQSTGSITNLVITGTGTLKYSWLNAQQQQVATSQDLINQPAGIYKLQVTDDSQCGPVFTTDIQIPETNGITLDETTVQTSVASCSKDNGSVIGIKSTGATKYQWADANNKVISSTADLNDVASGDYILTVSNNFGCSKTSKTYHVGQTVPTIFPSYTATMVPSCFGDNRSSVSVAIDGLAKSVRWVNSQGQTVGATNVLSNVAAGTYQLYLTDQNGCENYYSSYLVSELPEYTVASYGQVTNDHCGLKTGGITATTVTGGLPPYSYKWRNLSGDQLGTASSLSNIGAGTYILNVADTKCGDVDITYNVPENDEVIGVPSVSNIQLCSSGNALISVNNPSATTVYRLYDNATSAQPLYEQTGGRFSINISGNRSFYISQLNGTCESPRAQIDITVGLSALNIPNAFTPNGDGINDYWKISGIETYPGAVVQVFTRYGQKIFESKGYQHPFDGTFGGKGLPIGAYYYIINLSTNCSLLSGSLTIIR